VCLVYMLNILACVLVLVAGSSQAPLDTSSVASSQDLYMQFQEQKRKIEEELRLMEQRDLQWKEIQSGKYSWLAARQQRTF